MNSMRKAIILTSIHTSHNKVAKKIIFTKIRLKNSKYKQKEQ